jgi:hypothetical protein
VVSPLPADVERLLNEHIRTIGELEVLLLLQRDASRWWTPESVTLELRTSLHSASLCLTHLRDAKLVEQRPENPPAFRFNPARAEDAATVHELVLLFNQRMSSVINAIYAPRRDTLKDFANAFRITKKGEGEGDG